MYLPFSKPLCVHFLILRRSILYLLFCMNKIIVSGIGFFCLGLLQASIMPYTALNGFVFNAVAAGGIILSLCEKSKTWASVAGAAAGGVWPGLFSTHVFGF